MKSWQNVIPQVIYFNSRYKTDYYLITHGINTVNRLLVIAIAFQRFRVSSVTIHLSIISSSYFCFVPLSFKSAFIFDMFYHWLISYLCGKKNRFDPYSPLLLPLLVVSISKTDTHYYTFAYDLEDLFNQTRKIFILKSSFTLTSRYIDHILNMLFR